jgi:hypothetical protein
MRCLVAAGKHVDDIQAIAEQPPITTIEKLLEAVFSVGSSPRLYSDDVSSVAGYSPDSNDVSAGRRRISTVRIRCQETLSEDVC